MFGTLRTTLNYLIKYETNLTKITYHVTHTHIIYIYTHIFHDKFRLCIVSKYEF